MEDYDRVDLSQYCDVAIERAEVSEDEAGVGHWTGTHSNGTRPSRFFLVETHLIC